MQATVAKHGKKSDLPAISVTIVAAPDSIGMRISDQGAVHHIAQKSVDP
jgi:anti-sigma regulatory factor (Ser/Thr protein kinase)